MTERSRLTGLEVTAPGQGNVTTNFSYDDVGQLVRMDLPGGGGTSRFLIHEYDDARRLTAVEDALGHRIEYTLDAAGNRLNETRSLTSDRQF
jgi:YD repeat-containing protein